MIKQCILLCFFFVGILGCRDAVNNVEVPKEPMHDLHIEGEVNFHGTISWSASNNSLNTTIEVENTGTDTARIETGVCAFNVVAYSKEDEPVWYNRPPDKFICTDQLLIYSIAPKATKQLTGQMYISGQRWHWDIPEGDWSFKIESRTEQGELISFDANMINDR